MAQLSLKTGTSQALSLEPVEDGALLAPTDKKAIFLDQGNSRKEIKTGHTIQNSSDVNITDRDTLQFMGSGVSVSDDSTNNKTIINITDGVVAPRETSPAAAAHAVGDYIRYSGTVYKVKSAISIGDSLILNTNIEANGLPDGTTIYTPGLDEENFSEEISGIVNVYGSKNLLPNNCNAGFIDGITVTINDNKSITLTGASTSTGDIYIPIYNDRWLPKSEFDASNKILNGCFGGGDNRYYLYIDCSNDNGATANRLLQNNEDLLIPNYNYYGGVGIVIGPGMDFSTPVTIYPMIRDARIKDNTYAPYAMTNRELTNNKVDKAKWSNELAPWKGIIFEQWVINGLNIVTWHGTATETISKYSYTSVGFDFSSYAIAYDDKKFYMEGHRIKAGVEIPQGTYTAGFLIGR